MTPRASKRSTTIYYEQFHGSNKPEWESMTIHVKALIAISALHSLGAKTLVIVIYTLYYHS